MQAYRGVSVSRNVLKNENPSSWALGGHGTDGTTQFCHASVHAPRAFTSNFPDIGLRQDWQDREEKGEKERLFHSL
jgi:cytochrome c5